MKVPRTYRIVIKGESGTVTSMARSAREATEEAAKAAHHGDEVTVTDDNGTEITADALAELVKSQE